MLSMSTAFSFGQPVGGGCDGCEIMYEGMPKFINATDTSAAWRSTDKRMIITGTVFQSNGKTPAAGTIVYYYHTNRQGIYGQGKMQVDGKRHGQLRGWVKTDSRGNYRIYTCVPAAYPREKFPAHVHMIIKEPEINEYYIDDINFDDDPLLTTEVRKKNMNRGGSGVILTSESGGITYVERNITLGLHIPDYPLRSNSEIASGLSVGENCPAFDPIHFSGPDKGKNGCPMCRYGSGQGVILWWNDNDTESLITLLKALERKISEKGLSQLRVFAVYMNPENKSQQALTNELTLLAGKNGLQSTALLCLPVGEETGTLADYQLNKKVKNTIMVYRKRKVVDKFVNYSKQDISQLLNRLAL